MIQTGIIFLGGSQTFVGVLATVIVMCVLAGENNFIYKILSLIKAQMADNLKNVSSDINFSKLSNDSDYKLLKVLMSGNRTDISGQQKVEGGALLSRISLWKSTFQVENVKPQLQGEDREISLAPLYTFLFVLVVFLFDELLRSSMIPYNDYLVSCLSFFTLFSYVYWVGKWMTYIIDIFRNNGNRTYNLLSNGHFSRIMQIVHFTPFKKDYLRLGYEILWFIIIATLLAINHVNGTVLTVVLTVCGVVFPFVIEGFYHLHPAGKKESDLDKGYRSTLNHFGRFLFMSILVALIYFIMSSYMPAFKGMFIPYNGLHWLKIFTVGFVILNGLVAPSVLPFHSYRLLSRQVMKKPQKMQERVDKEIDSLLRDVKTFTSRCQVD